MNYLVIGDIHGDFNKLKALLDTIHKGEQLVFLGDYIDRGPDSKQVLKYVKEKKQEGAVLLRGNHEQMFIDFLDDPENNFQHYLGNGGHTTFESFGYQGFDAEYLSSSLLKNHRDIVQVINNTDYYYETEQYIFVHAGLSPFVDDWKDTPKEDFLWIRDWFHHSPINTNKKIVFGHTPTQFLNRNESNELWFSKDGQRIGIDGAAAYGGVLHALKVNDEDSSMVDYFIDGEGNIQTNHIF